ncbi:MAG: M6 family metalloprotease domain-containing protein [Candidatus Zixiibacteriota bacterium]
MNINICGKLRLLSRPFVVAVSLAIAFASPVLSNPPHPDLLSAREAAIQGGLAVAPLPSPSELHARGIDTPDDFFGRRKDGKTPTAAAQALGPFRVLAILVDFSDHTAQVNAGFFDTLVFGTGAGTVRHYFDEISYAQIDLITVNLPSSLGWRRAPQTYAYYVNNEYGMGSYPNNTQKLVEDLVTIVDPLVNFNPYDNDNDGDVDVLLVVHSGTGAELSGSTTDIWSHKWGINPRLTGDGVYVNNFTVQPEFWNAPRDMTIGVFAHELLHGFGLPDLYDTDGGGQFVSNGVGRWCIMSYGSWNGSMGNSPAHPCAWSRIELGITTAVNVSANINNQAILAVESGGPVFRLWTSGAPSLEYFLVENRQRTGYDAALPAAGLLIWHIDDAKTNNEDEWYPGVPGSSHFLVALEQADGLWELEHANDQGDAADPWPGSLNRTSFNGTSTPSSDGYLTGGSFVGVTGISPSGATMTANLIVGLAADVGDDNLTLPGDFRLAQNYPNPFNPSTVIEFELPRTGDARLDVYNLLGQHVRTLVDGPTTAGTSTASWDGTDNSGERVASGIYFYRLVTDGESLTRKMMLLK